jgi:hypothetical protein
MSSHDADARRPLVVVRDEGPEQAVTVPRGRPPDLRVGPGFSVYERRRDSTGKEIEEFITVIPASEATLFAVSDEQFNAWKGRRLIAKPMHLEQR